MLHRTRNNCDSKVILPVVAVEEKVEAFVVDTGAMFLDISEVGYASLYLD